VREPARAPAGDDTRARLVAAAEQLFAARGIEAVSLREISRHSGARNAIATQYHFKDRAGVLAAIMQKHQPVVEAGRQALLDQYEASGVAGEQAVRVLAGALVRPLAAQLADSDGGPEFLQIHAELLDRLPAGGPATGLPSVARWRALVDPLLERDAVRLHRRYTAILHAATELARRAETGPHTDDRLFVSYLVDVVTAILSFPVSAETRRLADERDVAVGPGAKKRRRAAGAAPARARDAAGTVGTARTDDTAGTVDGHDRAGAGNATGTG
jgi:AcrR family transcriptional regulator